MVPTASGQALATTCVLAPSDALDDLVGDDFFALLEGEGIRDFPPSSAPESVYCAWLDLIAYMEDPDREQCQALFMAELLARNAKLSAAGDLEGFYRPYEPGHQPGPEAESFSYIGFVEQLQRQIRSDQAHMGEDLFATRLGYLTEFMKYLRLHEAP